MQIEKWLLWWVETFEEFMRSYKNAKENRKFLQLRREVCVLSAGLTGILESTQDLISHLNKGDEIA